MSKSSEKPRLHQIPSEDMDSEDGGGMSPTEPTYQSRVRAESLRVAEPIASKSQEEQMNLQHALILNQVGKHSILSYMRYTRTYTHRKQVDTVDGIKRMFFFPQSCRWHPNTLTLFWFCGLTTTRYIKMVISGYDDRVHVL